MGSCSFGAGQRTVVASAGKIESDQWRSPEFSNVGSPQNDSSFVTYGSDRTAHSVSL